MADQSWKIIATPKDRWALVMLISNKDLKYKGKRRVDLALFIEALGLAGPNEDYHGGRTGRRPYASDGRTRHVFSVTLANAQFFIECVDSLDLYNAQLSQLQPIIDQLEKRTARASIEGTPEFNQEVAEGEDWAPLLAPILDEPDRYVEVNASLMKQSTTWEEYRARYIKESEPPPAPQADAAARPSMSSS